MVTDMYQIPDDPMGIDLPILGDDGPEGEAFSSVAQQISSSQPEVIESSSTVAAPIRRKPRTTRALPTDAVIELRNADLASWNANYLQNMKTATLSKNKTFSTHQAKKNAEYYVWGGGLGGLGQQLSGVPGPNPFDMFIGDNFFELVTGTSRKRRRGTKHDRDSGIDDNTQRESRRVRQKTSEAEDQIGRGMEDEGFSMPGDDEEVELPREGMTALDEQQMHSAMPWNISASIRGSSAVPRSAPMGTIRSLDRGKRGSRMVSASPLLGRGQPGGLDALRNFESEDDYGLAGDEFALPGPSSDYPEPVVATKTQPRVRNALSSEGENFFAFVVDAIAEKRKCAQADTEAMSDVPQADAAADIDDITFEELLPSAEHTKLIACQGLTMVLELGMKNMLDVQQPEHYGEINLKLTAQGRAAHLVNVGGMNENGDDDVSDQEDAREDDVVIEDGNDAMEEDGGHFEEQFAAGLAGAGDGEKDSLYGD